MLSGVPAAVLKVMAVLLKEGHEAYLVGGSVRDMLLGRKPKDYDVATDATPDKVTGLFPNSSPTGFKYGTVTVCDGIDVEVTTFRKDDRYLDGRHPASVTFSGSLHEDVMRRDFTVNGLALDASGRLMDFVGGKRDLLDLRLIRCIGEPRTRFREDALRMLRAHRFVAQLSTPCNRFAIERETHRAMIGHSHLIKHVSWERIRDELVRILMSDNPGALKGLDGTGLLAHILPEIALIDCPAQPQGAPGRVLEHITGVLEKSPKRLDVRLAALVHHVGTPGSGKSICPGEHAEVAGVEAGKAVRKILHRLRFDSRTARKVSVLVREHSILPKEPCPRTVKRFIARAGVDNLDDLFDLEIAHARAVGSENNLEDLRVLRAEVSRTLSSGEPLSLGDLVVNGGDLMEWGMEESKEIGEALSFMLERVLENPGLNTKEGLRGLFREFATRAGGAGFPRRRER